MERKLSPLAFSPTDRPSHFPQPIFQPAHLPASSGSSPPTGATPIPVGSRPPSHARLSPHLSTAQESDEDQGHGQGHRRSPVSRGGSHDLEMPSSHHVMSRMMNIFRGRSSSSAVAEDKKKLLMKVGGRPKVGTRAVSRFGRWINQERMNTRKIILSSAEKFACISK